MTSWNEQKYFIHLLMTILVMDITFPRIKTHLNPLYDASIHYKFFPLTSKVRTKVDVNRFFNSEKANSQFSFHLKCVPFLVN